MSLVGFVMVGGCLKLDCSLYLFIIKLLVSVRFWSELPVHISSILFALVFVHILHHIFFLLRLQSPPSLSSSCLPYYISPFIHSGSEKGLHCQPTLTLFCKEITDFKLRPEPISKTACLLHTYTKACVQRNQK